MIIHNITDQKYSKKHLKIYSNISQYCIKILILFIELLILLLEQNYTNYIHYNNKKERNGSSFHYFKDGAMVQYSTWL